MASDNLAGSSGSGGLVKVAVENAAELNFGSGFDANEVHILSNAQVIYIFITAIVTRYIYLHNNKFLTM